MIAARPTNRTFKRASGTAEFVALSVRPALEAKASLSCRQRTPSECALQCKLSSAH